ncbi:3-oxoacyl-[acyl-carrier protein] reductase/uncharacterized oxidoreductase [Bradyrhizobium sp. Gha]|nr:3-oxoacyl-[acyl-carrier protein] reductase/uncharacterized oxidoreductase [Bradyrhizobium sp. Gha]
MADWFAERTAIIIGCASGIGLAIASKLLALGSKLTIVDRDRAALQTALGTRSEILTIEADVTDRRQVGR